jgi:hypothetical protein
MGSLHGQLRQVADDDAPTPFGEFDGPNKYAALHLDDGRWLLCVLQVDGQFLPQGSFRPDSPQPKPR